MKALNLTTLEVQDLINKYYSELRKLEFQVNNIQEIIENLESQLNKSNDGVTFNSSSSAATEPKKRGRKKKEVNNENGQVDSTQVISSKASLNGNGISNNHNGETKSKRGRKPGRKKGSKRKTGGYKLSDFDSFIINSLKNSGQVLVNSDFLSMARKNNLKEDRDLNDEQLKAKLNRSLFKMANRRDELVKVEYPGKGFAYALSNWTDEYGNLKKRYKRDFENA